jgi:hypothetical protein
VVARLGVEVAAVAALVSAQMLGMADGVLLGKSRRDVDLGAYPQLFADGKLLVQEVTAEVGMGEIHLGGMVGPAVVALGEQGDGVDVTRLQGRLEVFAREAGADALDALGGVEIEVDLTVGKGHNGKLLSVFGEI